MVGILVHAAPRFGGLAGECKTCIRAHTVDDHPRDEFPHRWSVLETVTRSAPDNPDVVVVRMTVDDEIAGVAVLVRADPCFDDRR